MLQVQVWGWRSENKGSPVGPKEPPQSQPTAGALAHSFPPMAYFLAYFLGCLLGFRMTPVLPNIEKAMTLVELQVRQGIQDLVQEAEESEEL